MSLVSANSQAPTPTFRRMLETAVDDRTQKLGLQQEVTETGRMDANVVSSEQWPGTETAAASRHTATVAAGAKGNRCEGS